MEGTEKNIMVPSPLGRESSQHHRSSAAADRVVVLVGSHILDFGWWRERRDGKWPFERLVGQTKDRDASAMGAIMRLAPMLKVERSKGSRVNPKH